MFDNFEIGDRVTINHYYSESPIPVIGTIINKFWGRESRHNGDTSLCYEAVGNDGNTYTDEYDYFFAKYDGNYNNLVMRKISSYEDDVKKIKANCESDIEGIKTKAKSDIEKVEARIRALKETI